MFLNISLNLLKRVWLPEINYKHVMRLYSLKAAWLSECIGIREIAVQKGITQTGKFVTRPASTVRRLLLTLPAQLEKQAFPECMEMALRMAPLRSLDASTHTTWNIHVNVGLTKLPPYSI